MPSPVARPAAAASSTYGSMPRPATTAAASITWPERARTVNVPPRLRSIEADRVAGQHLDAARAVRVGDEAGQRRPEGARRPMPCSGKIITGRAPTIASAAAISEPMKPPPITTTRRPGCASARSRS